jgi:DNA-binding transcriptional regulator WhiA
MATNMEVTERQKQYLRNLLKLKKKNPPNSVEGLQEMIEDAVATMSQEDVAWVEKITGVKAID